MESLTESHVRKILLFVPFNGGQLYLEEVFVEAVVLRKHEQRDQCQVDVIGVCVGVLTVQHLNSGSQ